MPPDAMTRFFYKKDVLRGDILKVILHFGDDLRSPPDMRSMLYAPRARMAMMSSSDFSGGRVRARRRVIR